MSENPKNENPDYGVRLTDDQLAAYQREHQQTASQPSVGSEYGPQDGPASPSPAHQHSAYQQPAYQQPGQYVGQPQGFGGPQLHPDMKQEPARPRSVNIAFWSILAAGIAYFISQVVVWSLPNRGYSSEDIALVDDMLGTMMEGMPYASSLEYLNSPIMGAFILGTAIFLLIGYILVGLGIRNGWRSMRILGTVFAVLSLTLVSFASPIVALLTIVAILLGIVGIVFAWLPTTTEYYRRKAWQKAAKRAYPDMLA